MVMFRKATSVTNVGLMDFDSGAQRPTSYGDTGRKRAGYTARHAKADLPASAASVVHADLAASAVQADLAATPAASAAATPAGWYPDFEDANFLRWYDGQSWTEHRQPAPAQLSAWA
jgi:hypothetical protein